MTIDLSQLEQQYGLPPGLLTAVRSTESGGNPNAVSPRGALGAFQFMPDTAKQYGINPLDPDQAAQGAAHMYGDLLSKYNGDVPSALAAYNWGQGNVDRKGLQGAPEETQGYISKIMGQIGNAIIPSAQAAEMPDGQGPGLSLDDIDAELARRGVTSNGDVSQEVANDVSAEGDPDGLGSQPWSNLPPDQRVQTAPSGQQDNSTADIDAELARRGINPDKTSLEQLHGEMLGNAHVSMGPDGFGYGIPAALTSYAANAMQSIPFSDEVGSAIAATVGAGKGKNWGERYDNLQQSQQALREAGKANNPEATALGQISSGLASTPLLPVGSSAPATSALGAIAKGVTTGAKYGAGYGAAYGLGESNSFASDDEAISDRVSNAAKSALSGAKYGAVLGGPLGGVGYALSPKTARLASGDKFSEANSLYDAAAKNGQALPKDLADNLINEAKKIAPQSAAGKLTSGDTQLEKLIDRYENGAKGIPGLSGQTLTMKSVQEIDEGIGNLIDKEYGVKGLSKEGKHLLDLQGKFREMVAGTGNQGASLLGQARKAYAQGMRMRDIERIIERADTMDNAATSMRSGFRTLLNNPNRIKGYTKPERALIKKASQASLTGEALRGAGSRLLSIMALGTGHPLAAMAAQGVSAGSRGLAAMEQAQRAQQVLRQISSGNSAQASQKLIPEMAQQTAIESVRKK